MEHTREDHRDRDEESRVPFYSCAFCNEHSPKPFKVCESCGQAQPAGEEE